MTFMAPGKKWQDTTAPCIKELRTPGTKFTWILWAMWRSSPYFWYDLSERCFFVGFRHEVLEGQRNPSGETEHGLCCVREDVSTINSVQWCWSAKQRSSLAWGLHQWSWLLVLLRGETGDDLTLTSYLHVNVTILSSFQICTFLPGATVHMIEEQKVPYAVKQKEWAGYDNKASYDTKVVMWLHIVCQRGWKCPIKVVMVSLNPGQIPEGEQIWGGFCLVSGSGWLQGRILRTRRFCPHQPSPLTLSYRSELVLKYPTDMLIILLGIYCCCHSRPSSTSHPAPREPIYNQHHTSSSSDPSWQLLRHEEWGHLRQTGGLGLLLQLCQRTHLGAKMPSRSGL